MASGVTRQVRQHLRKDDWCRSFEAEESTLFLKNEPVPFGKVVPVKDQDSPNSHGLMPVQGFASTVRLVAATLPTLFSPARSMAMAITPMTVPLANRNHAPQSNK
jgi:hypothetical protein